MLLVSFTLKKVKFWAKREGHAPPSKSATELFESFKPIFHCNAKPLVLGVRIGQYPKVRILRWVYQIQFSLPPTPNLKFALTPKQTPNASQWNIGCVGSPGVGTRVGHVHFMLFVSISFVLGSQRRCSFQCNMSFILQKWQDIVV